MLLKDFKTAAKIVSGTSIAQVFFDYAHITNIERDKLYPYVLWNLNSWKGAINWSNVNFKKETIKVRVYILDYFDRGAVTETSTIEEVWDALRGYFRIYCNVLNTNTKIQIINLNNMPFEYYEIGVTADSEIGVSFDVELDLFC